MLRRGAFLEGVEQHHEGPRPLDMAEELVPQPFPFGGTLDQPGNVRHDELPVVDLDNAEMWLEGGEGVVGHLGLCRRDRRDQAALPRIGESDEGGVGEKLHLEDKPDSLPVLTLLGIPGGSVAWD